MLERMAGRYNILISININTNNPMFIKNPITAVLSNYANPTILLSRPRKMLESNIWNPQEGILLSIFLHLELRTCHFNSVTRLLRCRAMSYFYVFWYFFTWASWLTGRDDPLRRSWQKRHLSRRQMFYLWININQSSVSTPITSLNAPGLWCENDQDSGLLVQNAQELFV